MGLSALLYSLVVLISALESKVPVEGWASLMIVVLVVSSFQMIALGILGEYSWRILDNTRSRPNYVVDIVEK